MSSHAIPAGLDLERASILLARYLRPWSGVVFGNGLAAPATALEFTPDLSPAEVVTLSDVIALAQLPNQPPPPSATDLAAWHGDLTKLLQQISTGLGMLDAVDADVTQAPTLTAAQLTSATVQKQLWADVGKLSTILRRVLRFAGRQAGGSMPAEQ